MEYIIQIKAKLEIDAEDVDTAKDDAKVILDGYKELEIEEAKIVDKNSGYFV